MRIEDTKLLGDAISTTLSSAFYAGMQAGKVEVKAPRSSLLYDPSGHLNDLLQVLDGIGFKIGLKAKPPARGAFDLVCDALTEANELGRVTRRYARFNRNQATECLFNALDADGYEIVPKADAKPRTPIEIKLPDGRIHGYLHGVEDPKIGADIVLTPEDFTGEAEPVKPGKVDAAPSPWILKEVIPGQLSAKPAISDRKGYPDTIIDASATAVVTRQDGSDRREFQASERRILTPGGSFQADAGITLDMAIEMATALGEAFIESCETLASQTEEAA